MSKRNSILDVAERLFNEFGYNAVGVDRIRDETGISKTSMYHYFGSKSQLIVAVLFRRHQRFEEGLSLTIKDLSSTQDKLESIYEYYFNWFQQPDFKGCMFMHALAEFKSSDECIAKEAKRHKDWLKSFFISNFGGSAHQDNAQEKAEIILTFLEGLIIRAEFADVQKNKSLYLKTLLTWIA